MVLSTSRTDVWIKSYEALTIYGRECVPQSFTRRPVVHKERCGRSLAPPPRSAVLVSRTVVLSVVAICVCRNLVIKIVLRSYSLLNPIAGAQHVLQSGKNTNGAVCSYEGQSRGRALRFKRWGAGEGQVLTVLLVELVHAPLALCGAYKLIKPSM